MDYNEQKKLLMELTEELKHKSITKKEAIDFFHKAGIMTKKGKFTKNYPAMRVLNEKQ